MRACCAAVALSLLSTLCATDQSDTHTTPMTPTTTHKASPPPMILRKCPPRVTNYCDMTFEIYGEWLYLQPNGSNIYYAAEAFPFNTGVAVPPVSPNWQIFEIDPSYHSGFEIGSKFLFPKNDMSLEINWERLHTHDSDSMAVTPLSYGTGNMVGPLFDIGPNVSHYKAARSQAIFHFDAVNLTYGKSVCFMEDLCTRIYTGAGFSRIKQSTSSLFVNHDAGTSRGISSYSIFQGGGPQFGLDFDYKLYESFSFTGGTSVALYMGQLKNHTIFTSTSPGLTSASVPQPNVQNTTVPHRTQVVPGFEEKLGFSYRLSYSRCEITFGAGYQFQIYLDAIQSVDMTAPQVIPSLVPGGTVDMGVYAVGFERTLSNFILTGPYLSMNIDF